VSKAIHVSRERVVAAIEPYVLAALARPMVGHAGEAPGRSYDLAALDPVSLQPTADMRSIASFVASHVSRGLRRERWHKQ